MSGRLHSCPKNYVKDSVMEAVYKYKYSILLWKESCDAHKVKQNLMRHNQCKNLKSDVKLNLEIWLNFFILQNVTLKTREF